MKIKFQSPISIILLVGFFFLLLLYPFSSGEAQTSEWTPAWVDFSDSGFIHVIGLDANAAAQVESPISAESPKPEKPISTGLLAAFSQFFSSFARSINTPSGETAGWETIFSDDFEGAFPGEWDVVDNDGSTNGTYFWAKKDCNPNTGSYSAWAVGGGAEGSVLACGSDYPDNARSWMVYGPFSLADATDAEFRFMYWLNSEPSNDVLFVGASIDGINFSGLFTSGTTDWSGHIFDLTAVPTLGDLTGEAQVWVVFAFQSNQVTHTSEGAYVDDIEVRKYVEDGPTATPKTPTATPKTPTATPKTPTATKTLVPGDSEVYLPLALKEPYTGPTPTPTSTLHPTITPTPTKTPTPTATVESTQTCEQHDFGTPGTNWYIYSGGKSWDFSAQNTMTIETVEVRSNLATLRGITFHISVKVNGNTITSRDQYVNNSTFVFYDHSDNITYDLNANDEITYFISATAGSGEASIAWDNYVKLCGR
ncbi:MAG: hypothetical protein WA997_15920 [Anaerolineales bacterium]